MSDLKSAIDQIRTARMYTKDLGKHVYESDWFRQPAEGRWAYSTMMKTQFITTAMLVLALAVQALAQDKDSRHSAAEKEAIAAIKKLGGRVVSVSKNSGKADYVLLNSTNVTDAGLVHLKALTNLHNLDLSTTKITDAGLVHLKGSAKLRTLYLEDIKVTDAGLVHLKGLTGLQHLHLGGTNVTNAGLLHLKGLTKLQYLYLLNTEVGDAGLAHLKGLTKLKILNISDTKVTAVGVKKLQDALPKCQIQR